MDITEILDERVVDDKDMVVKNKTKLEGLGVNQKPDQDKKKNNGADKTGSFKDLLRGFQKTE